MKFKQHQQEFQDFLKNITNLNGLYLESHSICKCELSIQLRLRYNGKRRLFVLCGDKSPLDDDEDEDISIDYKEDDNVLLEEGATNEQNPGENDDNEIGEEEKYEETNKLRNEIDSKVKEYINKYYSKQVTESNIYFDSSDKIIILISAHNINMKNFWSGEWLSSWEYDIKSKKIK